MAKFKKYQAVRLRTVTGEELAKRAPSRGAFAVEGLIVKGLGVSEWVEINSHKNDAEAKREYERICRRVGVENGNA